MSTDDIEKHSPIPASTRDTTGPVWDMSQERAFIETLLNQRFNFLIVCFSLVIAGALNCKVQLHLQLVFSFGALLVFLLSQVLERSQEKLDIILADLFSDPSHPAAIVDKRSKPSRSRRRFIGLYIPRLLVCTLVAAAIAAWSGYFQIAPLPSTQAQLNQGIESKSAIKVPPTASTSNRDCKK